MSEQKKEFKGVWIPKHIIEDEDLSCIEVILYSEISCFDVCFKSNKELAKRLRLKNKKSVSYVLKKLKDKGYIKEVGFNGRSKFWKAKLDKPTSNCGSRGNEIVTSEASKSLPIDKTLEKTENIAETSSAERNHIFKENSKKEDKSNLKASKKKETFNCKTEIGKMMNDKQKHIEIIGCFFNAKKYTFPDKISLQAQLKRNLRPARELARYDNSKFSKAYGCVKKKFPEEWNLNTMLKYIPGI